MGGNWNADIGLLAGHETPYWIGERPLKDLTLGTVRHIGAQTEPPKSFLPALELMYQCLSLGFMGRYRLSPRGPAEIDQLREELYAAIAAVRPRAEADLSPAWRGVAAPYRPMRMRVPLWVAGTAGLAVLGAVFAWSSISLNQRPESMSRS